MSDILFLTVSAKADDQQLNDSWEYIPDHDAAKAFFACFDSSAISSTIKRISNLCQRCSRLKLWISGETFSDTRAGLAENANYCALCRLLSRLMQDRGTRFYDPIHFFRVGSHLTTNDRGGQPIASLYSLSDNYQGTRSLYSHNIQSGFPILPSAGSPAHVKVLAEWIRSCDHEHRCCPRDLRFVPTRLVDVGSDDDKFLHLSSTSHDQSAPRRYMALSHQWGSGAQHRKFCTYRSNIKQLHQKINVADLPKTFQDAVRITRSLGVRYLWVDSLCIVQDDPHDWERESRLMEQVFSSAYCTLAASCARGADDGFLQPRPERNGVTLRSPHSLSPYYLYESIDNFHLHVDQGELNMRGWVLQERALSRRTIYFTETQAYWECGRGVRCETLTKSKNRKASFLGDSNFPHSVDAYVKGMKIELYQYLFERYSNLSLSFSTDRPIAIKGLETRLLQTFGTTGGYGVFDLYFHRCLLWQRAGETLKRITSFRGIRVPSWSWMAYDGGIRYMHVPYGGVSWRRDIVSPFAKVKDVDESTEIPSGSSAVTRLLQIEAPAWDFLEQQSEKIVLDEPNRKVSQPTKCVVIGESNDATHESGRMCYVLIIVFVAFANEVEVWERVGVGAVERRHIILDGPTVRVHIQ